ncbi:uncharacterized protein LOC143470759 [Clavelina lepadiformis]|uniref:uncharacterized protein LOC143470759 n=1 Tax=Clavelina lepadiformis TaxID=159417 RepID=UPI004042CE21
MHKSPGAEFVASLNTVQEWYIINTASFPHPIHIHVNNFQVISYNNYTGPIGATVMGNKVFFNQNKQQCDRQYENFPKSIQAMLPDYDYNQWLKYRGHAQRWRDMESHPNGTLGYSPSGIFHDVILVPPFSNITIRFQTDRFIGTVVIHCHILYHEDHGMMMVTKIVPDGANTTGAHIKSGDAYPGQCSKCDPFPFNEVVGECSGSRRKHFNIIILIFALGVQSLRGKLDVDQVESIVGVKNHLFVFRECFASLTEVFAMELSDAVCHDPFYDEPEHR